MAMLLGTIINFKCTVKPRLSGKGSVPAGHPDNPKTSFSFLIIYRNK